MFSPALSFLPQIAPLLAESAPVPWDKIGVLIAGIAFLLVLILYFRLQAFVALILTTVVVAILSGMPLTAINETVISSMGGALGMLATIVGLGAIFGQVLEYSGGAQSLATGLHRTFGEDRAPLAMILVGFLISVPVFFDVALVILAPILVALAKASGKSILRYGLPLCAAMAVTHACIPPTPGPILVIMNLGGDLGQMILWGAIVGLPTALVAGILGARMGDRMPVPIPKIFTEAEELGDKGPGGKKPVAAIEVVALILLPIILILGQSLVKNGLNAEASQFSGVKKATLQLAAGEREAYFRANTAAFEKHDVRFPEGDFNLDKVHLVPESGFARVMLFIGHPVTALLLTTLVTLVLLGTLRGIDKATLMDLSTRALGPAGIIILVTGAGGVFKGILGATGISDALGDTFGRMDAPLILVAFLVTAVIRVAQGSATVAMIAGSSIMAGAVAAAVEAGQMSQPDVALMGIAIACGATMASHVNDSGFWVVKNYLGMTEKQTLQTFTIITSVIGVVGFVIAWVLSLFV